MSQVLVQYLREARATEAGLTQTLQVHIAATPPGDHRERLERHLETTRTHEQLLAARLREVDGGDPLRQALDLVYAPIGYSLGIARGATRAMLSVIDLPRTLLLREPEPSPADRVLRNVRAEAASSALELATYTAIERLAEAEGDQKTARLAAQLRADEEEMAAYLRDAVVELSDRLAGPRAQRTEHRAQNGNGAAPVAEPALPPEPPPPPPATRPLPTEPAEPAHVSEEPELVAEFAEPGAEEEAGAEVEIAEPWEGYDLMKAGEIQDRLAVASDEEVAVVRLYESAGRNRQTVVRAAERRLRLG